MIRRALLMLLGVGSLFVIAPSLPASASAYNCVSGSGHVCLYSNANYATSGCVAKYLNSDNDYSNNGYDYTSSACYWRGLNDDVSSIRNRGNSYSTRHYEHARYRGAYRTLARGGSWPTVFINDELSSHQWIA